MAHQWFELSYCIKCNIDRRAALFDAIYKSPREKFENVGNQISNSELIDIFIPCISNEEWIIKQALE